MASTASDAPAVAFWTRDGVERNGVLQNGRIESDEGTYALEEVQLVPPVTPGKIVCVARNYRSALDPEDVPAEPDLFLKAPNAIASHRSTIRLPDAQSVYYEGELGVVIGERCRNVPEDAASTVIGGYVAANDLTDRSEDNIVRRKSFDDAAPVGPTVTPPEAVPADATIEVRVNDEVQQSSSLDDLVFGIPKLIADISAVMTLREGDVILTGTPPGMGSLADGDTVTVDVEGVPSLQNRFTTGSEDEST